MDENYFKALDIKSNFIKMMERKKLINKNLLKELKRQGALNKRHHQGLVLVDTINDKAPEQFFLYQKTHSVLQNPVIGFKLGDKQVVVDCVKMLSQYIVFTKEGNSQEISFYLELL